MKKEIKTIVNCTDEEFLRQSAVIRHALQNWLDVTKIMELRKRKAQLEEITSDMTEEEAQAVKERNAKRVREQVNKNFNDILDACLEEHPEETLKIIRLCCFVKPDDNSRKVTYYLGAFAQILNDKDVLDFFTSLENLGQTLGFEV